jgi:hypothetical protein
MIFQQGPLPALHCRKSIAEPSQVMPVGLSAEWLECLRIYELSDG